MPNIKSAKKRARQNKVKHARNVSRKSAIKTAVKKIETALKENAKPEETKKLLQDVESKIARAKGKGLYHANTAARKVSRLAKKVAQATK